MMNSDIKIVAIFLFILANLQGLSFAQQNIKSLDSVEKTCPLPDQFPELDRRVLKGFVLVRGVINQKGEVIEQSIVYSNSDENLNSIAIDNFQKCTFQKTNFDDKNFTVLKKYQWNYAKLPISFSSAQIFRKDKDCDIPQYPMLSKSLDEIGRVSLDFQLDELNYVISIKLKKSSGFLRLDEQSVMHLISCRSSAENNSQKWKSTNYDWKLY